MSIVIFIATDTVNRLIREVEEAGIVPDIKGQLGPSDLLRVCYTASLPALPHIDTADNGLVTVRAPVNGMISFPGFMGMKYRMEAAANIRMEVDENRMKAEVGDLAFEGLTLGNGCPLPRRVLDLLGPFVHSLLFRGLGIDDNQYIDIPPIRVPLSMAKAGVPPMDMMVKHIEVSAPGITALLGMEDDSSLPASLPDTAGWDLTVAVCEGTAEDIAAKAMNAIGDIEGTLSFNIPDPKAMADLVFASAETLTTFGRKGLGRRALRSASSVEVNYKACVGRPNLSFGDGEKIILCKIPARVCARAELISMNYRGGFVDRVKAFFRPSLRDEAKMVRSVANSWNIDGDFVLERAEVTVVQKEGAPPKLEVTLLDLEMDLPWPLPNEMLEKMAEGMGKDMISARLPNLMSEIPLPPEVPFEMRFKDLRVSTCRGRLTLQANLGIAPPDDPEAARRMVEERIRAAMPVR